MPCFCNPLVDAHQTSVKGGGEFRNWDGLLERELLPLTVKSVMSLATTLGQTDTYRCDTLTV
jgi:hypothetical protein